MRSATSVFFLVAVTVLPPLPAKAYSAEAVTISAVREEGTLRGFDVAQGGRVVAPVRLSSSGLLTAARVEEREGAERLVRFSGL